MKRYAVTTPSNSQAPQPRADTTNAGRVKKRKVGTGREKEARYSLDDIRDDLNDAIDSIVEMYPELYTLLLPLNDVFRVTPLGEQPGEQIVLSVLQLLGCKVAHVWLGRARGMDPDSLALSPPPYINEVWHRLLLNPVLYFKVCERPAGSVGVQLVHHVVPHNPLGRERGEAEKAQDVEATRRVCGQLFEEGLGWALWGTSGVPSTVQEEVQPTKLEAQSKIMVAQLKEEEQQSEDSLKPVDEEGERSTVYLYLQGETGETGCYSVLPSTRILRLLDHPPFNKTCITLIIGGEMVLYDDTFPPPPPVMMWPHNGRNAVTLTRPANVYVKEYQTMVKWRTMVE